MLRAMLKHSIFTEAVTYTTMWPIYELNLGSLNYEAMLPGTHTRTHARTHARTHTHKYNAT